MDEQTRTKILNDWADVAQCAMDELRNFITQIRLVQSGFPMTDDDFMAMFRAMANAYQEELLDQFATPYEGPYINGGIDLLRILMTGGAPDPLPPPDDFEQTLINRIFGKGD